MTAKKKARVFTDGSARYTQENRSSAPCGWAYIIVGDGDKVVKKDSGFIANKTHNHAELLAIKQSLLMINKAKVYELFDIYSDSRYCVDGINTYMHSWNNNRFRNIKNPELWREVYKLFMPIKHKINIIWTQAHVGNIFNDMVDHMAKEAITVFDSPALEKGNLKENTIKAVDFKDYLDKEVTILVGDKEKTGRIFSLNTVKNTVGMVYPNNMDFIFYLDNGNVTIKK